jgi:hypothetical protein
LRSGEQSFMQRISTGDDVNRSWLFMRASFPAALAACLVAGCGGSGKYPVHGSVTMPDGRPLPGVVVEFAAVEGIHSAVARTREDGTYALSTDGHEDGALPGAYRVRLIPADVESDYNEPEDEFAHKARAKTPAVPLKYQSFDTSGMQFVVSDSQANQFDIALAR